MLLEQYSWLHGAGAGRRKNSRVPPVSPVEAAAIGEVQFIAYGVLAPIILAIGVVGNLLVLLLLRQPQFKGVVFSYFTVLAVADFLSLVFCISPLHHILNEATPHYSTAVWYSYFEFLFVGVAMSFSVFTIVSITIHRFYSVCRPSEFKRVNTSKFSRICILVGFCVSVVAWGPICFLREPERAEDCASDSFTPPDNDTYWVACLVNDMGDKGYFIAYVWVRQALVSFIPIIIVVSLNFMTLRGFLRHRRSRHAMLNQQASGQPRNTTIPPSTTKEERYLLGLLIAVMTSFTITIIPSGIANAINITMDTSELNFVIFKAVANLLEILNHTLNFYLYVLCSKPVREALQEYYTKYSSELNRILTERFRGNEDEKDGGRMRASESPMSKSTNNTDSEKVFAISCNRLDSAGCVHDLGNDLGREENGENENVQENVDNLFPHVIPKRKSNMASSSARDNPIFECG